VSHQPHVRLSQRCDKAAPRARVSSAGFCRTEGCSIFVFSVQFCTGECSVEAVFGVAVASFVWFCTGLISAFIVIGDTPNAVAVA